MKKLPLFLVGSALSWVGILAAQPAPGARVVHGVSLVGELNYPPGFTHFDYVNPEAPKGGRIRLEGVTGTYDSFNSYIVQGTPDYWSAQLTQETLLATAYDAPSTMYGWVAESIEVPDDSSWVIYNLREEARFHDGVPITADDVAFSLELLKDKGQPVYQFYYQNVASTDILGPHRIRFNFDETGNRELPFIVGQLPVFARHYWEGLDEDGNPREFGRSSLEPPLGSGPYRVSRFDAGRFVEFDRVDDYWARDLPVNVGRFNFDIIRVDYYRDRDVSLQAFFSDEIDVRLELTARNWATAYDRPPVRDGSIKRDLYPSVEPVSASNLTLNLRRNKFADRRVRQALGLAFNFEWINENIFYGQYERVQSYWHKSELAASGLPSADELELLEPYRDQLPPELFTTEYMVPVSDGTETNRNNLFRALQLLQEAGWRLVDGRLVDSEGEPFEIEFLIDSPGLERVFQPYLRDLERLGISGSIRLVDATQYTQRVQSVDFDVISYPMVNSLAPGNEQREFWGSATADEPGTRNYPGVKSEVVDALVEALIFAPDRESLITATHALDRVLLWNYYTIPAWTSTADRYAYWDRFGRPDVKVEYGPSNSFLSGIPELWWSLEAEE